MEKTYKNVIDDYYHELKEIIKNAMSENKQIFLIKKDNDLYHIAFLDDIAKSLKDKDLDIKILSNKINNISILEFNYENLIKFIENNSINKEFLDFLENKEELGIIYITKYKMDIYKQLNINNKSFLDNLKKLLLIEEEHKLRDFISYWGKTKLYYATVNHYFNQKLTDKNFINNLINYSNNENFTLVVDSKLYEILKSKQLPKNFRIN